MSIEEFEEYKKVIEEVKEDTSIKPQKTYNSIINVLIARPDITKGELAEYFGITVSELTRIIYSDRFNRKLNQLNKNHVQPVILRPIHDRLVEITVQSLDIIQDKINMPSEDISDNFVLRVAEMSTKAMGLGLSPNVTVEVDSDKRLKELASRIVKLAGIKQEKEINVIENEMVLDDME